jgi:uncharacterized protein (DUF983 family)
VAGARRVSAVVRQRCPACLEGQVFRSTLRMLPACQRCGHRFEPRPGTWHRTFAAAVAAAAVVCLIVAAASWHWLVPEYGRAFALLSAAFLWLLLLPAVFRYARIIRAHLDASALERARR